MFSLLYIIIIDCWLTLIFFYFSTDGCINKSLTGTYLLTYLLTNILV